MSSKQLLRAIIGKLDTLIAVQRTGERRSVSPPEVQSPPPPEPRRTNSTAAGAGVADDSPAPPQPQTAQRTGTRHVPLVCPGCDDFHCVLEWTRLVHVPKGDAATEWMFNHRLIRGDCALHPGARVVGGRCQHPVEGLKMCRRRCNALSPLLNGNSKLTPSMLLEFFSRIANMESSGGIANNMNLNKNTVTKLTDLLTSAAYRRESDPDLPLNFQHCQIDETKFGKIKSGKGKRVRKKSFWFVSATETDKGGHVAGRTYWILVKRRDKKTLTEFCRRVVTGSRSGVWTDAFSSYVDLMNIVRHASVNHSKMWKRADGVNTNAAEGIHGVIKGFLINHFHSYGRGSADLRKKVAFECVMFGDDHTHKNKFGSRLKNILNLVRDYYCLDALQLDTVSGESQAVAFDDDSFNPAVQRKYTKTGLVDRRGKKRPAQDTSTENHSTSSSTSTAVTITASASASSVRSSSSAVTIASTVNSEWKKKAAATKPRRGSKTVLLVEDSSPLPKVKPRVETQQQSSSAAARQGMTDEELQAVAQRYDNDEEYRRRLQHRDETRLAEFGIVADDVNLDDEADMMESLRPEQLMHGGVFDRVWNSLTPQQRRGYDFVSYKCNTPNFEINPSRDAIVMLPLYYCSHWVLVTCRFGDNVVEVRDSIRTYAHGARTEALKRLLRKLYANWKHPLKPTLKRCDQQKKANDCGLHVVNNMMNIMGLSAWTRTSLRNLVRGNKCEVERAERPPSRFDSVSSAPNSAPQTLCPNCSGRCADGEVECSLCLSESNSRRQSSSRRTKSSSKRRSSGK